MRKTEGAIVHGDHPVRIQIQESARGISGASVDVAERRRVVGSDGKQCELRGKTHSDLAEAGEVSSVAGVINRMLAVAEYVAAVTSMRIAQHARSPMTGWNVRDRNVAMAVTAPPVQFDDIAET